jgi:ectoine hydroxylase
MVHGSHKTNPVFANLVRSPRILTPATQLLDDDVYVHQFKVNAKAAFAGDIWAWHQDYIFWQKEDGMPTPRTINAAVFLDEVTEFNGPLVIIPTTHQIGMYDEDAKDTGLDEEDPDWKSHLTVALKYELKQETLAEYVNKFGMVAPKGAAGSVLFFAPSVFHGSAPNISPFDRALALVSYNSVENKLLEVEKPRPWFLAERDFTPLAALEVDDISI